MSYHFQTLSSYTTDSEPAAMISFPQRKYLINVPEGAQRITTQIMTGLKGLKVVFLTSLDADVVGGLPGQSTFSSSWWTLNGCRAEQRICWGFL